jgi:hypothetical protein
MKSLWALEEFMQIAIGVAAICANCYMLQQSA